MNCHYCRRGKTSENAVATVLALLLLASVSFAASYEASDVNPEVVPPTSTFYLSLGLENTGSAEAREIKVKLVSSDVLITSTGALTRIGNLKPDEKKTLNFPINVQGAAVGDHTLTLVITDTTGTTEIAFKIEVSRSSDSYGTSGGDTYTGSDSDDDGINEKKKCDNDFKVLGANLLNEPDHEINPTDRVELVVYMKSLTKYKLKDIVATISEDHWRIRADGKWFFYDFLAEGKSKPGYFVIQTENANPGTYQLDLDIEYEKEGHDCKLTRGFNITVKGNYGVYIDLKPDSIELNPDAAIELSANIRNTGSREDTYSLRFFEGVSDWVHEYPKEVSLKAGEAKSLPITLYIPEVTGSYQLGIKAISNTLSSIIDTDVAYLSVAKVEKPVHRLGIDYPRETFDVSPGETKSLKVKVENLGTVREDVKAVVDGPYWAFIAPAEFPLEPGERRDITLYFAPDENEEMGTLDIRVNVYTKAKTASSEGRFGVYVTGGATGKEPEPPLTGEVTVVYKDAEAGEWDWLYILFPLVLMLLLLGYIVWRVEREEVII